MRSKRTEWPTFHVNGKAVEEGRMGELYLGWDLRGEWGAGTCSREKDSWQERGGRGGPERRPLGL